MSDPATIAYYQRESHRYTASGTQAPSRHLDAFLDRLKPGARVLELGCGGGRDTAHMFARGFDVDPTDGAPAMARKAEERIGRPVRVMTFDELAAEAAYDAAWAHACLLHVPRKDLPEVLVAIRRALRPGGWHYANYKLGEAEGRDLLGRLTNLPDPGWLEDAYCAAGFTPVATERYAGKGCDAGMRDWLAVTVRKAV